MDERHVIRYSEVSPMYFSDSEPVVYETESNLV